MLLRGEGRAGGPGLQRAGRVARGPGDGRPAAGPKKGAGVGRKITATSFGTPLLDPTGSGLSCSTRSRNLRGTLGTGNPGDTAWTPGTGGTGDSHLLPGNNAGRNSGSSWPRLYWRLGRTKPVVRMLRAGRGRTIRGSQGHSSQPGINHVRRQTSRSRADARRRIERGSSQTGDGRTRKDHAGKADPGRETERQSMWLRLILRSVTKSGSA